MNDRPPSGVSTPIDTAPDASYAAYDASYDQPYGQGVPYSYATGVGYPPDDPLFGALPGQQGQPTATATASPYGGYDAYDTSGYDTSGLWSANGTYGTDGTDGHGVYTGTAGSPESAGSTVNGGYAGYEEYGTQARIPAQPDYGWTFDSDATGSTGQWDTTSYGTGTAPYPTGSYPTGDYDTGDYPGANWDWDSGAYTQVHERQPDQQYADQDQPDRRQPDPGFDSSFGPDAEPTGDAETDAEMSSEPPPEATPLAAAPRGRRRAPKPKRSALLTVAVPSVAVMGVAGIAAASVNTASEDADDTPAQAAGDATQVKPSAANSKLDTQLAGVSADAGDFADRASRTQERIDLKERQEAERKRKEAEAARKEAERPKFALPVAQQGLSAYYGQAGINWMSVHTGVDFPVSYGTPVRAATDGTVTTKWDLSYGNMAVVTATDGTETWYCHLSSTKIRSGQVKAGDTIAYSGNSGNSTGPHLHFEVRPGGGSAVDPLAWFRAKGLDPT